MKLFKSHGLDILFNDSNLDYKGVFSYDIDYSNIISTFSSIFQKYFAKNSPRV